MCNWTKDKEDELEKIYGKNFCNKEEYLAKYRDIIHCKEMNDIRERNSVSDDFDSFYAMKSWLEIGLKEVGDEARAYIGEKYTMIPLEERTYLQEYWVVRREIECCEKDIVNKVGNISKTKKYLEIFEEKMRILQDVYSEVEDERLEDLFGKLDEKKGDLIDSIRMISFAEGVELYKYYQQIIDKLKKRSSQRMCDRVLNDPLEKYLEFYELGSILISDQLNRLNKVKARRKDIPRSKVEEAMLYFYEAPSIEEAEKKREQGEYIENKEKGAVGEREVDYALKWLDKSYINIAKTASGKYGEDAIILYNPEFIDEKQEYDNIIIGEQGIFLIEIKNYAGKLIVDANGNWIRIKKDGTEEGEKNPIQQLRRHEKLLKSIVGDEVPIISLICMANAKMIIEGVENSIVPIIKSDMLVEYIETYKKTDCQLSDKGIRTYQETIEKYMQ